MNELRGWEKGVKEAERVDKVEERETCYSAGCGGGRGWRWERG